jgi:hypothetical protein
MPFETLRGSRASGLEVELTIALDSMFPMPLVVELLTAFTTKFPSVPPLAISATRPPCSSINFARLDGTGATTRASQACV